MDIRVINKNNEIINVTNLNVMTMDKWLVGMNDRGETVRIEEYKDKEEAQDRLIAMGQAIEMASKQELKVMLVKT